MSLNSVNVTANYDGQNWNFTGDDVSGTDIEVVGPSSVQITVTASSPNTVALPTSGYIQWANPNRQRNFIRYTTVNTTTSVISFNDACPEWTYDGEFSFQIGYYLNGGNQLQYTPDPIIINKDPDGTMRVTLPKPQLIAAHS